MTQLKSSSINNILVISLTNIGDVVLTWPVIDAIKCHFSHANVSVIVGENAASLFEGNPFLHQVIPYDKHMGWKQKWQWLRKVRKCSFDVIVDLRNSVLPFLLDGRFKTWPIMYKQTMHMKDKHLSRLNSLFLLNDEIVSGFGYALTDELNCKAEKLLNGLDDFIVIAPGAKGAEKRWSAECFQNVAQWLINQNQKIVLLGDVSEVALVNRVLANLPESDVLSLAGKTQLNEVPAILKRAKCALLNDSGIMHMASYVECPVIALFGPTDPAIYGPWGLKNEVIKHGVDMSSIRVVDVVQVLKKWL